MVLLKNGKKGKSFFGKCNNYVDKLINNVNWLLQAYGCHDTFSHNMIQYMVQYIITYT